MSNKICIPISESRTCCNKKILNKVRSPVKPTEPEVCTECLSARRPGLETAMFYGVKCYE